MKEIYLDNSATTAVCKEAADRALFVMTECYGNPSSLHYKGLQAQHETERARKSCASLIGCESDEIYFTSGGTESNNTALFGAAGALKKRGRRIVTSLIEHSSVIEAAQKLESDGFDVVFLQPGEDGCVSIESLANAVTADTVLVSLMLVNNETGSIQPVEKIRKIIDKAKAPALIHTDAVQAFGKIPIKVKKLGVDLLSASSHKIHGPKGAGILYVGKGARIVPLLYGGEQQKKIRPGTECVPAICGMGAAVESLPDIKTELSYITELNLYLRERLSEIDNIHINSPHEALPYILNFSLVGIRSETTLHFLEQHNIYVSSGSACAKGKKSHVLSALGLTQQQADSAIRVSFSRLNTKNDIDELVKNLIKANNTLARAR